MPYAPKALLSWLIVCLLPCAPAVAAPASAPATQAPGADAPAVVHFVDGAHDSGWLGFEFFRDQRIFLPARVNGRDTVLLLDSGAEMSVLDSAFAASLGLAGTRDVVAKGTGGTQEASFLPAVDVELGSLRLQGIAAAAIDLSEVSAAIGHPLPLVLGNEVFRQTTIEIDFQGRRIRFLDADGFQAPEGFRSLAVLDGPSGIRRVEAHLEGEGPLPFDFDLGNGSPLLLSAGHWQQDGWLRGRRVAGAFGGAIGGMREQQVTRVRSLELAGFELRDLPATLVPPEVSALEPEPAAGNLGLPVFTRFRLVVDYPRDRLLLAPAEGMRAPFAHDRSGLFTRREGGVLEVVYVVPGSPAAQAGWRAGERIVAIDGTPVAELADAGAWRLGEPGRTVSLATDDGRLRQLALADYF